jgi:hypothetical protein
MSSRDAGAEFVAAFARDLAYEWCEIYEAMSERTTNIVRFQCGTFEYLYDDYASLEAMGRVPYDPVTEARLVAVSGRSLFQGQARDDFRLKGWVPRIGPSRTIGSSPLPFEMAN